MGSPESRGAAILGDAGLDERGVETGDFQTNEPPCRASNLAVSFTAAQSVGFFYFSLPR